MAVNEINITLCGHGSGNPSTKNMKQYLTQRYNSKMSNGIDKGVLCVKRLKTMTDEKRREFHDTYKIILGRNIYNQDLREYVYNKYKDGNYYSDCSSSYCATLRMIGFQLDWLLNTVGILESELFEDVPVKIEKGHIVNPEVLKVADAVLFKGNASRAYCDFCGHIEAIYEIDDPDKKETPNKPVDTTPKTSKFTPYIGQILASQLNVRSGPGMPYKAFRTVSKGTYVYITEENGDWGKISDGWISLKYVNKKSSFTGKTTASYLNVREKPIDGDVKKIISKGTTVKINKLNAEGTWGYDTKTKGWVSMKYIKI
jgi:SH3-like domain-containing protein